VTTITNNRIRIAVYGVIFLSLAPFLVALPLSAATENIAKLVFVTDKQTIDPDVLSNTITVQTQNNAGGYEKVDEKTNLEFSSNSATGRFFSTSGAEVQEYMASGSYNKNFLYQDSATGNFTITVKATGDISDRTWQASQQITVGNINDDEDSDSDTDPTPTAATTTSSSSGFQLRLNYSRLILVEIEQWPRFHRPSSLLLFHPNPTRLRLESFGRLAMELCQKV